MFNCSYFSLSATVLRIVGLMLLFYTANGDLKGQQFDCEQIKNAQVRQMLQGLEIKSLADFQRVGSYCYQSGISYPVAYSTHQKKFVFEVPLQKLWDQYLITPPDQAWKGRLVDFGLCYGSQNNEVYLPYQQYPGLEVGQLHFLELNFLGLAEIAVGHQVTAINSDKNFIKLCYLQGGQSQGSQWIFLRDIGNNRTEVSHFTRYKSDSKFRDNKMYPLLHSWVISLFHRNIARLAQDELP